MKKSVYLLSLGLIGLTVSGTIIGVTVHQNMKFIRRGLYLKYAFFNMMKKVDPNFDDKYKDKMMEAIDKTVNIYYDEYRDEVRKEIESLMVSKNIEKIAKFWTVIRPFFDFVWDHRENKRENDDDFLPLVHQLREFARGTEPVAFKSHTNWYLTHISLFVRFYNQQEKEELNEIVKKINKYRDENDFKSLYKEARPLFLIWSDLLLSYIWQPNS